MPRWEPHARERLETAALDLYASQGYEDTTVSDIANRAGVTSRTYFRYFPDKREVLFGNADELRDRLASSLRDAPSTLAPLAACVHAIESCDEVFRRREHDDLTRREAIIDSAEELREREARKLDAMAADVAIELHNRGTEPPEARLVADIALAIFTHASRLWMHQPGASFAAMSGRAADAVEGLFTPSR